jgi:NTP pyrophosphatase (non-canonical NTP hydrolase)
MKTVGVRVSDDKLAERINKDCADAIHEFGQSIQMIITAEECAELIKAISKFKRYKKRNSKEAYFKLIKECVDVQIMLIQMFMVLDVDGTVDYIFEEKLDKLETRLNKRR